MIKLALVDDSAAVRDNLERIFDLFDEVKILWIAGDGKAAVQKIKKGINLPDVILMDIEMRVMSGIEATRRIKALQSNIKVVMLSIVRNKEEVQQAIYAGADGYLLKDEKPLKMLELIKDALEDRYPLSPEIAKQTFQSIRKSASPQKSPDDYQLTKREIEILEYLVSGQTYTEMAEHLSVSPLTIRSHMENLYRKLNVHNKVEAVSIAIKNSWF